MSFFPCMAHGSPSKIYELPWMTSVCCFACDICNSDMLCRTYTVPFDAIISSGRDASGEGGKKANKPIPTAEIYLVETAVISIGSYFLQNITWERLL